jgi:hypothetical protein
MIGASQELYELAAFPRVLHGQSYRTAASFIFDSCHAVLLAVEGTAGTDSGKLSIASMEQVKFKQQGSGLSAGRQWSLKNLVLFLQAWSCAYGLWKLRS